MNLLFDKNKEFLLFLKRGYIIFNDHQSKGGGWRSTTWRGLRTKNWIQRVLFFIHMGRTVNNTDIDLRIDSHNYFKSTIASV